MCGAGGRGFPVFSRASRALRGSTQVVTFLSVRDKNMSPAQPTPPCNSPKNRVKVQTKTEQKIQCRGGLKLIFVDQIWVQSFKLNRLI